MIRESKARASMVKEVREAVVHIRVENPLNGSGKRLQNPSSQNNNREKILTTGTRYCFHNKQRRLYFDQ